MATVIVKNTDTIDHQWGGIVVPTLDEYTVQEVDRLRFLSDSDFLTDLTSGLAVINDGVGDLTPAVGLLALKLQVEEARFNNVTNGFTSTDAQAAIEEVRRELTIPTSDQSTYVSKLGDDTTGNGSIGAPYLTITKALTSITDATSSKRYAIHIGPGNYTEDIALKPHILLVGSGTRFTIINGSTLNIADSSWSSPGNAGAMDLQISNVQTLNFSAQAGNTTGNIIFFNCWLVGAITVTANTVSNQIIMEKCSLFGAFTMTGTNSVFFSTSTSAIVINSGTTVGQGATTLSLNGGSTANHITATWTANGIVTVNLRSFGISNGTILTASGASCTVNATADSIPVPGGRNFTSGATLVRINDNFAKGLLSATTNIDVSAATAPIAGQTLTATSSTAATWQDSGNALADNGDGSDGNVSLSSGTTILTRDMYYNSLTLSGTAVLDTSGWKIYAKTGIFTSNTASIINNGSNGNNASGSTIGAGGAGAPGNSVGSGQTGSNGGAYGANTNGSPGGSIISRTGYGGNGGVGGTGGDSGSHLATGGAGGNSGTYNYIPERIIRHDHIYNMAYKTGGEAGTGGGGGASSLLVTAGAGGGGGGGGGVIVIFCKELNNASSVGITAVGGNGGTGGNAGGGNSGSGGGGAGGGGGFIYIVTQITTAIGTLNVSGGTGGATGTPTGGGFSGTAGANGSAGHTSVVNTRTLTWTVT